MNQANTIINALGGGRFLAEARAVNVAEVENGIGFQLPKRNAAHGINAVKVGADDNGPYTLRFLKIGNLKLTRVAEVDGVAESQLQEVFTRHTLINI